MSTVFIIPGICKEKSIILKTWSFYFFFSSAFSTLISYTSKQFFFKFNLKWLSECYMFFFPLNRIWGTSLDTWINKPIYRNADRGQILHFIGKKQSVAHVRLFSLLALFISSRLSFYTNFYGSHCLCLYGAIGKYTASHLIISWPVERSHSFCVVLAAVSKKNSTNAAGKQSSLWPSHSSDALPVTALRHITGLAQELEVPDWSYGGVLRVGVWGEEGVGCRVTEMFIV